MPRRSHATAGSTRWNWTARSWRSSTSGGRRDLARRADQPRRTLSVQRGRDRRPAGPSAARARRRSARLAGRVAGPVHAPAGRVTAHHAHSRSPKGCRGKRRASASSGAPRRPSSSTWWRSWRQGTASPGRDRLALEGHPSRSRRKKRARTRPSSGCSARLGRRLRTETARRGRPTSARRSPERVTTLLVRQKTLVKVDTLLFHAEALDGSEGGRAGAERAARASTCRASRNATASRGSTRFRCWSIWIGSG